MKYNTYSLIYKNQNMTKHSINFIYSKYSMIIHIYTVRFLLKPPEIFNRSY